MQAPWALLWVFGAIGALYVALRVTAARRGAGAGSLRVVESCALGPKTRLHVVEVDGERLLVSGTESGVRLLRRLPSRAASPPAAIAEEPVDGDGRRRPLRRLRGAAAALLALLALLGAAGEAQAQQASGDGAQIVLSLGDEAGRSDVAPALELLALLTVMSIAPSILLMATCFTRIVIVLAFVRQAVGVQHLPPNQVLVGLSLFLTLFVMAPTGEKIHSEAWVPYMAEQISLDEAGSRAVAPIRRFMLAHTREVDLALFIEMAEQPAPATLEEVPMSSLLPAFLISELRTAFEIGFMVFLPFLIIDLVISSMLISMGMIVLPPVVVSLPFKVMLFVLADGWNLILGSLVDGLR